MITFCVAEPPKLIFVGRALTTQEAVTVQWQAYENSVSSIIVIIRSDRDPLLGLPAGRPRYGL